jgi:hypothetical protein
VLKKSKTECGTKNKQSTHVKNELLKLNFEKGADIHGFKEKKMLKLT